jgi:hypothetical protein
MEKNFRGVHLRSPRWIAATIDGSATSSRIREFVKLECLRDNRFDEGAEEVAADLSRGSKRGSNCDRGRSETASLRQVGRAKAVTLAARTMLPGPTKGKVLGGRKWRSLARVRWSYRPGAARSKRVSNGRRQLHPSTRQRAFYHARLRPRPLWTARVGR